MSRRGPIIAAVASALLAILLFVLLILPKMNDVKETREQVDQAKAEQVALESELARLEGVREDAPRIRRQLARFRKAVPPVADLPGILNQIQDAAGVADVDFFSIQPGAPLPDSTGVASEIPSNVQVIGGFFQVDEFLFRLETLPRAAKVVSITVGPGPDGAPQIDVTLAVEFYTTDTAAGPGAPLETAPGVTQPGATPSPTPSPTPEGV